MLINDLLVKGREKLEGISGTPGLDAEVLLAHALGMSREELLRDGAEEVDEVCGADGGVSVRLFDKYCDEVLAGRPVAYTTGVKEFYGLDFFVDERVLIPRPETEMIVDEVLAFLRSRDPEVQKGDEVRLLDVGTGSLAIASAIVKGYGYVFAHAVDISEDALEVARRNSEVHGLETHVQIYQSDLLGSVSERDFDVIVANLPYIGEVENRNVSAGVLGSEPSVALFGGYDGLELYKKMIQQILEKNVGFDLLVGEIGDGQEEAVNEMLSNFFEQGGGGYEWEVKKDLAGISRIFVVKRM